MKTDKLIIEKLKEIVNNYQACMRWILRHTPEIQGSQRGNIFLAMINELESELSVLEQEDEYKIIGDSEKTLSENKIEECEHPFAFVQSKCNGEINHCL